MIFDSNHEIFEFYSKMHKMLFRVLEKSVGSQIGKVSKDNNDIKDSGADKFTLKKSPY